MKMARVQANLTTEEYQALLTLASNEKRNPRYMAGYLIKQGLLDRGLLRDGMATTDMAEHPKQWTFIGKYKPLEAYQEAMTYLGNRGYMTMAFNYESGVGLIVISCSQKAMTAEVVERVYRFIGE